MTARYLAVLALQRMENGGYSNLVLDAELKKHPMPPAEQAFATALFYSVLEHKNTLDYILNQFLKKPVARLDAPVQAILRSGLAQLRYLRTPPSAAVNEAVKLTRAFGKSSAAGLVNAVLRRAGSYDLSGAVFESAAQRLCVLASVSPAVAAHFLRWYPDRAEAILTAPAAAGVTAIRVNTLRTTPAALAQRLMAEGAKEARLRDPGLPAGELCRQPGGAACLPGRAVPCGGPHQPAGGTGAGGPARRYGAGPVRRAGRQKPDHRPADAGYRPADQLRRFAESGLADRKNAGPRRRHLRPGAVQRRLPL